MEMNTALEDAYKSDKNDASAILRNIDDSTKKLLLVNDKYKVIEEDVFHNLDGYFESVRDRRENPEKHKGITSGFEKIDELTGGWKPGELIFVLGRPGHGKSVLLLNFGYHAYMDRCNVIYITIEMPIEQQRNRFYSILTKTNYSHLKSPHLLSDESVQYYEKKIREEQAKHNNYFWFIDAPENCTASFLESRVSAFESTTNKKCDLLLIDPIYLMRPMIKTDDPVGTISWDLKLLARKMKIPVICASQFNRESAKKHEHGKGASTSDAAFSDKLSQNADAMIGIINDMNGRAKLQFPKTRDAKQIKQLFFNTRFDIMSFEYDYDSEDSN
jgi:replicative DNA helicase